MKNAAQIFSALPDTVIFTDAHWYVLDYNRADPFEKMKKGKKFTRFMPDCVKLESGEWRSGNRCFMRTITPLYEKDQCAGYAIYLVDMTEKAELLEQSRQKSRELSELMKILKRKNEELEQITRQAEVLSDYSKQLHIAKSIHDGAGHAITAIHAVSQMCLDCKEKDPARYYDLLDTGIDLCKSSNLTKRDGEYRSLKELLENFCQNSPFPVHLEIHGEEPEAAYGLYPVIYRICREAYHNTLSHSLADKMQITLNMDSGALDLEISDNGSFRGEFQKGFGLINMEKAVLSSGGKITFLTERGRGFGIKANWQTDDIRRKEYE